MKAGWKYVKLGEVCEILNGFAFKSSNYVAKGIRVVRITNVQKGYVVDEDPKFYPETEISTLSKYLLYEDDLLMSLTGNVGRVGILPKSMLPAALNQRVACIRLKTKALNLSYLYHYLNSNLFETKCIQNSTGAAQLNMSTIWLANQLIPLPSLSEQGEIVAYLDKEFALIDALREKATLQLQAAKDLFQSALKQLLTPKQRWEEKKIGEIATSMFRGAGITRAQVKPTGIPCVRYGEIYTTYQYAFKECISHANELEISPRKYFEHGDLLFAITGESVEDIGKTIAYLGTEKCLAGGDIVIMKHHQNAKYLSYALSTPAAIKQKGAGKTKLKVVHTNVPALQSITIPLPPLSEQEEIVRKLDALSEKCRQLEENYRQTITLCNDLKQALLRQVFE